MASSVHRFTELLKILKKVHNVICNESLITDKITEKNCQTFSMYHSEIFNIHGSVHHKSILIMVQRDATGCSLFYFSAKNTLHVSGVSNTHQQEYIKL
jgi:hypothetical protein